MIHHAWYALNATRKYPLADSATGVDDNRLMLPGAFLADLQLRWPRDLGEYAFLTGLTISAKLITVTFAAADEPDSVSGFTPLAALTLVKPAKAFVNYQLAGFFPGVGGFVVFGDTALLGSFRFSSPAQSLLLPRTARPYAPSQVTELRKQLRAQGLSGLISLKAGPDIDISEETLIIDGAERAAVVIALKQTAVSGKNVFKDYLGPCGARPESGTCIVPGVETINGVAPDCAGNIDIRFIGIEAGPYSESLPSAAGVALDASFGLPDICPPATDDEAELASDSCNFSSAFFLEPDDESASVESPLELEGAAVAFPYTELFDDETAASWTVGNGAFELVPGDSPEESASGASVSQSYAASSTGRRNVALLHTEAGLTAANFRAAVHLSLESVGSRHNGGIVLDYDLATGAYLLAMLDRDTSQLKLLRFNGSTFITLASEDVAGLVLDDWYEILALVILEGPGLAAFVLTARGITDPAWSGGTGIILVTNYADGYAGVGSDRSATLFSEFIIKAT